MDEPGTPLTDDEIVTTPLAADRRVPRPATPTPTTPTSTRTTPTADADTDDAS